MNKPTKYKSVDASQVSSRPATALSQTQKSKVDYTINKLMELIKLKHS